jgi:hypothetical protein
MGARVRFETAGCQVKLLRVGRNAVSDGAFEATHHDLRVLSGFLLFLMATHQDSHLYL